MGGNTVPMEQDLAPGVRVRDRQVPLRAAYAADPGRALITDSAWSAGHDTRDPMLGVVHVGGHATAEVGFGVHHAIGGTHVAPVPGDLLCAALASCQESSLRMVANVLGVRLLELRVSVQGCVDVRGTLGMGAGVPVGFQSMRVHARLRPAPGTHPLRLRELVRAAERSCVVLQTLRAGVPVDLSLDLLGADPAS